MSTKATTAIRKILDAAAADNIDAAILALNQYAEDYSAAQKEATVVPMPKRMDVNLGVQMPQMDREVMRTAYY